MLPGLESRRAASPSDAVFRFSLIGLALIAGAWLRWHHLGWESAWLDEAYSIELARSSVPRILAERWTDIHPPLYYLSLHWWITAAGHSEAGARMLSVIFDLGAIVAAALVGTRILGADAGIATAWLLAISPFHIEQAQEARMYALLGATSTASMLAFVSLLRTRRRTAGVLYVAATTALLYTHIYSVFTIGAQMATLAIWWVRDPRAARGPAARWAIAAAACVILYVPWMAVFANQFARVNNNFWLPVPDWSEPLVALRTYAGSLALLALVTPLAIGGAFRARHSDGAAGPRPLDVLLPWLIVPILVPVVASRLATPMFQPKYAIAASVPFALLAGAGLAAIPHRSWRAVVAGMLAVLTTTAMIKYYGSRRREGWRDAVAEVERLAQPNDLVLFYPWFYRYPFDYYRTRTDLIEDGFPLEPAAMAHMPGSDELTRLAANAIGTPRRVWLVALQGAPERVPIAAAMDRHVPLADHIVLEWIEMDLFAPRR